MSALLLAAAAAASFTPPSLTQWQMDKLLQVSPARQGSGSGAEVIDAQVDQKGRVSNCKTVASFGKKELADAVCGMFEKIQIEPASISGKPGYGVIRTLVRLLDPIDRRAAQLSAIQGPGDIELQVNALPSGKATLRVTANVLVGSSGKPLACYTVGGPDGYGDVACAQVSGITFGALKDKDQEPVQYVRTVIVDFVTQPAAG